jgi:putative oxidoreductase
MTVDTLETVWAPRVLSILRIVAALLFFEHGSSKLFGFPPSPHSPEVMSLPWIAGVLEVVGGALLVFGLFTRPVAFILSGQMAVAYWLVHHKADNFYPLTNAGDAAILFCFIFLYFVFAGGGSWSLDAVMRRRD